MFVSWQAWQDEKSAWSTRYGCITALCEFGKQKHCTPVLQQSRVAPDKPCEYEADYGWLGISLCAHVQLARNHTLKQPSNAHQTTLVSPHPPNSAVFHISAHPTHLLSTTTPHYIMLSLPQSSPLSHAPNSTSGQSLCGQPMASLSNQVQKLGPRKLPLIVRQKGPRPAQICFLPCEKSMGSMGITKTQQVLMKPDKPGTAECSQLSLEPKQKMHERSGETGGQQEIIRKF
uniref:Uncharacterized protein n=1 Tax=Eptatretus burgeri TaxID=7764 RepID=A0A8C4NER7_EPTBU